MIGSVIGISRRIRTGWIISRGRPRFRLPFADGELWEYAFSPALIGRAVEFELIERDGRQQAVNVRPVGELVK